MGCWYCQVPRGVYGQVQVNACERTKEKKESKMESHVRHKEYKGLRISIRGLGYTDLGLIYKLHLDILALHLARGDKILGRVFLFIYKLPSE